jgi:hypothetical protein
MHINQINIEIISSQARDMLRMLARTRSQIKSELILLRNRITKTQSVPHRAKIEVVDRW